MCLDMWNQAISIIVLCNEIIFGFLVLFFNTELFVAKMNSKMGAAHSDSHLIMVQAPLPRDGISREWAEYVGIL